MSNGVFMEGDVKAPASIACARTIFACDKASYESFSQDCGAGAALLAEAVPAKKSTAATAKILCILLMANSCGHVPSTLRDDHVYHIVCRPCAAYSAATFVFSAAGAMASTLFFFISSFKAASSLDCTSRHAASCVSNRAFSSSKTA